MRSRPAKAVFTLLGVLLVGLVFIYANNFDTAWLRQQQAKRLLTCLGALRPGETTEAQARQSLSPFSRYEIPYAEPGKGQIVQTDSYTFYNTPEWEGKLLTHLPDSWRKHLILLPWTLFEATVRYENGYLSEFFVVEMQEDRPGYPHPFAASTQMRSTRFEEGVPTDGFTGYAVYDQSSQAIDIKGSPVGPPCCEREFTILDERASAQQRSQSLNFHLSCFTSIQPCRGVRRLRPPI